MNRLLILAAAALLTFAISAPASEVAEVAKKEKARREASRKEGKSVKTFTNQDVANIKSTLAFESTTPPESTEAEQPSEVTTLPAVDPNLGQPVAEQQQAETEKDEEAEKLRDEREALEQQAKDAQQTINQGGGYHTRNIGTQFKAKREAESRIREIDQELEKKEKEEKEE